jgi:hypothetical protein
MKGIYKTLYFLSTHNRVEKVQSWQLLHSVAIRGTVCNIIVTKCIANGDAMLQKIYMCYIASPFAVQYVTICIYRLVVTYRASSWTLPGYMQYVGLSLPASCNKNCKSLK